MNPTEPYKSEQLMQMNMLMLRAVEDRTYTAGGFTDETTVYNFIEVISSEVTLSRMERYLPHTRAFENDANMHVLQAGVYFGYFRNISVTEGTIRIARW